MVSIHVEPTSRCTLCCPRCERTVFIDKFGKKNFSIGDVDIDALENFIDTRCDDIILCGNVGDPIYHREFLKLVKMCTLKCQRIIITTNGSYKSRKWWRTLNNVLRTSDEIQFSIDGLPENFTKYRVNADWDSIQVGIEECVAGPATTIWKYIPFSFNEHDIAQTRELSQSLGIDKFRIYPSDRWLIDDPLRPSESQYTGRRDDLQQQYKKESTKDFEINPENYGAYFFRGALQFSIKRNRNSELTACNDIKKAYLVNFPPALEYVKENESSLRKYCRGFY